MTLTVFSCEPASGTVLATQSLGILRRLPVKLLAIVFVSLLLSGGATAVAQTTQHPPATIMLDASDFITVLKWGFVFFGLLLAVIAALGVTFFGFDVRNARASIDKEMGELRRVIEEAKTKRNSKDK
jgi:hypothetical protein